MSMAADDAAVGTVPTHRHSARHDHAHSHPVHPGDGKADTAPALRPARASLLMTSAAARLGGALGLIALLWAAVAWALSGTP